MEETLTQDPTKWTKLERIRFLLDHWTEIFDPDAASGMSVTGGEGGIPLLPLMAHHPSVVELAGCLGSLAADQPVWYMHLKAYRCSVEWRTVDRKVRHRLQSGHVEMVARRVRERIVPRWIRSSCVADAEMYLAGAFNGEVFIPKDLWKGLLEPEGG